MDLRRTGKCVILDIKQRGTFWFIQGIC